MRVVVTGASGMAGSHLADHLLADGHHVHIVLRPRSRLANVQHLLARTEAHTLDLRSALAVEALVRDGQFDWIFHLAAMSSVPLSWRLPDETIASNVGGTLNLLEAVRQWSPHSVVHVACSSEQYGRVDASDLPIRESQPFRPLSPYAVSKIAQEYLGLQYAASYGLRVCVTRAFNHEGPRRWETSAPAGFAQQVAEIEAGLRPPVLRVGNLDAVRDYLDVRDVVRAYVLAVERRVLGRPLNVASGRGWRIREVLDAILQRSEASISVEIHPDRLRPADVPRLVGDASAFRDAVGWQPRIPFEATLEDMLAEQRAAVTERARHVGAAAQGRGGPWI